MNMGTASAPAPETLTATQLRKNLFQHLEAAAAGRTVHFTFKGKRMRLDLDPSEPRPSKLARLVARPDTLLTDSDDELIHWNKDLLKEWEAKWAAEADQWFGDDDAVEGTS